LRDCFPDLARAELEDILRRYRRVWKKLHTQLLHRLRWPIPGRVWAMDFTEAPRPIDGLYPHLFAVRDLASGNQLLWLPVPDLTAVVQRALASLFAIHGPPLVLKMDNGSAFLADDLQKFFTLVGVIPLFSPPYFPRYNGAAEAGIGSLKTRTEAQAVLQGHPGHWTWNDAATAQLQANATARPRSETGPTADDLWHDRTAITVSERELFQATLQRRRIEARLECSKPHDETLSKPEHRALDRKAISRTLVELGYLLFSRRRIALPIKKQKVTNI
jgi:transposase InsO family protein